MPTVEVRQTGFEQYNKQTNEKKSKQVKNEVK